MASKVSAEGNPNAYRGYQECFLDSPLPDRLKCSICTKVLRNPHLMVCCGQKYCVSCLELWFHEQKHEVCPYCRTTRQGNGVPLHFLDKGVKSEVESLSILCSNCEKGCEWVGELREVKGHLENCGYVEKYCPNKCRTGQDTRVRTLSKDLNTHLSYYCELRQVECRFCGLVGPAKSMFCHEASCKTVIYKQGYK